MPGEQLLLINPRRRKRAKNTRKRRRHKNARRAAGGFRIKRRRVKNPRSKHRRRRNPRMRHHRRRHKNPLSVSGIKGALVPAAFGAVGGVALDVAYNFLAPYIPSSITSVSPYMPNVLKLAGAFGIGMVARKTLGNEKGNAVMAGALTIQIYNVLATLMGGTPGMAGLAGMGAYLRPTITGGLGSPNPAAYLQRPMGRMGRVGRVGAYMPNAMPLSGLPFAGLHGASNGEGDMMF